MGGGDKETVGNYKGDTAIITECYHENIANFFLLSLGKQSHWLRCGFHLSTQYFLTCTAPGPGNWRRRIPLNKQPNGENVIRLFLAEDATLTLQTIQDLLSCVLSFSCSYLAVHSSADAVRVLCRRGDQPSLRTALQVLFEPLDFFVHSLDRTRITIKYSKYKLFLSHYLTYFWKRVQKSYSLIWTR